MPVEHGQADGEQYLVAQVLVSDVAEFVHQNGAQALATLWTEEIGGKHDGRIAQTEAVRTRRFIGHQDPQALDVEPELSGDSQHTRRRDPRPGYAVAQDQPCENEVRTKEQ